MYKNKINRKNLFYWLVLWLAVGFFALIIWAQTQIYSLDTSPWPSGSAQELLR